MTEPVRRWLRSMLVAASVALAAFAGFASFSPLTNASAATARAQSSTELPSARELEIEMIERINALRVEEDLRPLAEDRSDLTAMARSWSAQMAGDGGISHRPDLTTAAPGDWLHIGENVGVGGSIAALHDAFVASPLHHRNLVDPAFESIGVGVVVRDGRIWVTQNFMQAAPAGTTPVPDSVELTAPPGGLGHKTCVTARCRVAPFVGRRIAFVHL